MRRLPSLSALRAFEAAARHGSFKRAAEELSVTPTAISHQIRSLEEHTGLALFERQLRKVVLTESGVRLYPVLRDGFDAFEMTLAQLTGTKKRPRVTVSATHAFTAKWLVPRVAGFQHLHPHIDLQLHASDAVVDLTASDVDIAIRYGRGTYPGLRADALFTDHFAPVANPVLGIRSLDDLERVPLIHFEWKTPSPLNPTWDTWFTQAGLANTARHGHLRFSDEGHAIQAAVAGQGIALLSLALVADELAAGHLAQPFGPTLPGHTYHLLMKPGASPEAQAAADWLRSCIAAD